MGQIFVSYSRRDVEWVRRLVEALEARGYSAWVDQRDIPVSLPWLSEVHDAILAADLFLMCDSPAARDSKWCGAEAEFALEVSKQSRTVDVAHEVSEAAQAVVAAMKSLSGDYLLRTELAVLAQDWSRSGRPNGSLVTARHRERLRRAAHVPPSLRAIERAFLRASRARTRRRVAVTAAVAVTAFGSFLGAELFKAARDKITKTNAAEAAAFSHEQTALQNVTTQTYQGLAEAARSGGSESAINAEVISAALRHRVPDDAFSVPARASRFYPSASQGKVVVIDGSGHAWGRGRMDSGVRSAKRIARPRLLAGAASPDGLTVRRTVSPGIVEVLRSRSLHRKIVFANAPSVLRFSPNGRALAAATGGSVEIADVRLGSVRTALRGSGPIRDLLWSRDGSRLWALTPGHVISWPTSDGTQLVDDSRARFEAVFPAADRGAVWVVSQGGELRELQLPSGRTLRKLVVHATVYSAAGSADGTAAALSGPQGEWIVPRVTGGRPERLQVDHCSLGRPAFRDATIFFVPCMGGQLLTVSVLQRKVIARTSLDAAGVEAVKVAPRSKTLFVSDGAGHLFDGRSADRLHEIWKSQCGASILRIGLSPDERALTTVGSGTGAVGCAARGLSAVASYPPRWHFDAVQEVAPPSILGESVAFSREGSVFAYGLSDGTIILHSTVNILPTVTITTVDGAVRDMFVTDNDQLVVVTDAGIVEAIPICAGCQSNRALSHVAAQWLQRALALGLAVRRSTG